MEKISYFNSQPVKKHYANLRGWLEDISEH